MEEVEENRQVYGHESKLLSSNGVLNGWKKLDRRLVETQHESLNRVRLLEQRYERFEYIPGVEVDLLIPPFFVTPCPIFLDTAVIPARPLCT